MVLAVDTRADFEQGTSSTSWPDTGTWEVTYGAGANYAVVLLGREGTPATVTVQLGGVTMTELAAAFLNTSTSVIMAFYILAADLPAGGTARAITISDSANAAGGAIKFYAFTGASQEAPLAATPQGGTNVQTVTVTKSDCTVGSVLLAQFTQNRSTSQSQNTSGAALDSTSGTWDNQGQHFVSAGGQYEYFGDRVATSTTHDAISVNVDGSGASRRHSVGIIEILAGVASVGAVIVSPSRRYKHLLVR